MLRASANATDQPADLDAVRQPDAEGGVDGALELAALVDTIVAGDPGATAIARSRVVDLIGPSGAVDATAVVANFEMMTRIADATGCRHESVDADVARATGADRFDSVR